MMASPFGNEHPRPARSIAGRDDFGTSPLVNNARVHPFGT
jgi:hypothetical protein